MRLPCPQTRRGSPPEADRPYAACQPLAADGYDDGVVNSAAVASSVEHPLSLYAE